MSKGCLYIVATPIGNLGDISPRAAEAFEAADFIAAEDTRVTAKLLNHLQIKKPLVSYYQHNMRERGDFIISRIVAGESCALCSDAGTPAISDPGEVLVKQAVEEGITVVPIPGACAAISALSASGLASGRFCFEGFIPVSKQSRRERLAAIKDETRTLIFYEAPHKLKATLKDLLAALGDRKLTIARELTKLHEEIAYTTLGSANDEYREREPRGEYVLVVEGAEEKQPQAISEEDILEGIFLSVESGLSLSDACRRAAAETGRPKSELYKLALAAKYER